MASSESIPWRRSTEGGYREIFLPVPMPSSSTRPPQHLRPEPPEPQVLRQFHQGIVEAAEETGAVVVGAHRLR